MLGSREKIEKHVLNLHPLKCRRWQGIIYERASFFTLASTKVG